MSSSVCLLYSNPTAQAFVLVFVDFSVTVFSFNQVEKGKYAPTMKSAYFFCIVAMEQVEKLFVKSTFRDASLQYKCA